MNILRLRTLVQALRDIEATKKQLVMPEGKSSEKFVFDFNTWGRLEPTCETAACAMGVAAMLPEFQEQGLYYIVAPGDTEDSGFLRIGLRDPESGLGIYAPNSYDVATTAAVFFDIERQQAEWLFHPEYYPNEEATTAEEIADNIERLIEQGDVFWPLVGCADDDDAEYEEY